VHTAKRLAQYRRKRDFAVTPEPADAPASPRRAGGGAFVVQLHHARARHFDFRLELAGTLRSWAIPKGPSLDPAAKRLAVQVEDHPLAYARFEGRIPAGEYGAGKVWIWDRGTWTSQGNAAQALQKGHLRFTLRGQRLRGEWSLVRTRFTGKQPQWLLLKIADAAARAGEVADDVPLSRWRKTRRAAPLGRPLKALRPRAEAHERG
jgi:bifunctional non-homologous end joining protein LigD